MPGMFGSGKSSEGGLRVPPPPPQRVAESPASVAEVTIRTMVSDLAMIGESGGSLPQAESVSIPIAGAPTSTAPMAAVAPASPAPRREPEPSVSIPATPVVQPTSPFSSKFSPFGAPPEQPIANGVAIAARSRLLPWLLGGAVGLIILFLIGYYVVPLIFPSQSVQPQQPSEQASSTAAVPETTRPAATSTPTTPPPPVAAFTHQSFFKTPADTSLDATVTDAVGYGADISALGSTNASSSFIELNLKDSSGQPVSWTQLLTTLGMTNFDQSLFADHFMPDVTAFLYRDRNGIWPGYVVRLKSGETPVLLRSRIAKIESIPAQLVGFFVRPPGISGPAFTDTQVSGQPVRMLSFAAPGASFAYGWFHNDYFVVSTSQDGMKQAVERL
jgi:hypothetical protein